MTGALSDWIVCQIGAREHYGIAKGLMRCGALTQLYTDIWATPGSPLSKVSSKLRGRFDPEVAKAEVHAFNFGALSQRAIAKIGRLPDREAILRYNSWFEKSVSNAIKMAHSHKPATRHVFAYSYAALSIFRTAKDLGWPTILGQIDPGPKEAEIVSRLADTHGLRDSHFTRNYHSYWASWREEVDLADLVVVNSQWSKEALTDVGITETKILVLPLSYENSVRPLEPKGRTEKLKILFLGQANPRKGIIELIEASKLLVGKDVEIEIVGPAPPEIQHILKETATVNWKGPQPRSEVGKFYREADALILPTHSDGFAITQYEALSYGVPVIASHRCGKVIEDGKNGLLLSSISGQEIANHINQLINDPSLLFKLKAGAASTKIPYPEEIASYLMQACEHI